MNILESLRNNPGSPTDEQIANALRGVTYARIDNWLDTDFLQPGWWVLVAALIIAAVIWWLLVDKRRLLELTLYGLLIMALSLASDEVGYELVLWYYPIDLVPVFPPLTAVDVLVLPVVYSLIYQYCPAWNKFTLASLAMSAVFSFVMEPLLVKFGFYVLVDWQYYQSFPIYFIIAIVLKYTIGRMKACQTLARTQG